MKIKKQVTATIELENEDVAMLKEVAELSRQALASPTNIYPLDAKRKIILFLDQIFAI